MFNLLFPLLAVFDNAPKFLIFGPLAMIAILGVSAAVLLALLIPSDAPRSGNVASGRQLARNDPSIIPRRRYWTE